MTKFQWKKNNRLKTRLRNFKTVAKFFEIVRKS